MTRVMLVNPPWYAFLGGSSPPPLGLISLAGSLKTAGHDVTIFNADIFGDLYASEHDMLLACEDYRSRLSCLDAPIWKLVRERLRLWEPDVVGVHVKTPSWFAGRMVARIAKDVLPNSMTVCGGPHVSCMPCDVRGSEFDFGICGEGELPFIRLLGTSSCEDRSMLPSVVSSKQGPPFDSKDDRAALTFVKDLDSLSFSGWDALADIDRHDKLDLGAIMTARGCPFGCRYCASHRTWERKVRYRSPENVVAEIDYLTGAYGVRYVKIQDDTFTVDSHRAALICDMMRKRKGIKWSCTTRADCVDLELAKIMAAGGCCHVSVGVESGVDRILHLMGKGETVESIRQGCACLKKAAIPFVAFVMIGFPSETEMEAQETLEFAVSLGADSLCGSVVTPYPGTSLYKWAVENGRVQATDYGDWRAYYHQSSAMGLWDVPSQQAKKAIEVWFKAIEDYNERPIRLIRRFIEKCRSDPAGTVHRAFSVLHGKLSR